MSVDTVIGNEAALKRHFSKVDKAVWQRSAADFVIATGGIASTAQIMENHGGTMSDVALVSIVVRRNPHLVKTGQRITGTPICLYRVSTVYEPKKADVVEDVTVECGDPVLERYKDNGKLKSEQQLDLVASRLTSVTKSLLDNGHYDKDRQEVGNLVVKLKIGELDFSCEGSSIAVERQLNRVLDTLVESGFFTEKNAGVEI